MDLDELERARDPGGCWRSATVHFRGRESGVAVDEPVRLGLPVTTRSALTRFELFVNRVEEGRAIAADG